MHAPITSTITLVSELVVSSAIYYVIYQGFKNNKFMTRIAALALAYEILFNITYMISRVPAQKNAGKVESPFLIGLAITHGVLSLIMFVALIVFFVFAWRNYKKGVNFFKSHRALNTTFLFFWTFSVLSGIIFYIVEYVF